MRVLFLVLIMVAVVSGAIQNRDVLEEHEVAYATREQIVSMSRAGITHEKILTHLRKFHFKSKTDEELRDIVLAAHLEKNERLPKGLEQNKRQKKRDKTKRSATKPKSRRR